MTHRAPWLSLSLALACTAHPPSELRIDDDERDSPAAIAVDPSDPWTTPGSEPWRRCANQTCIAGRFTVTTIDGRYAYGRIADVVPGFARYPEDELRLVDSPRALALHHTYAIVAGAFSMEGWNAVLVLDDDAEGIARVHAILRSPHAYENDDRWQQRRAAWAGFAELVEREQMQGPAAISVWDESEDGRWLALAIGNMVWIYDHAHRKLTVHSETAKIDHINRIAWKHDGFVLWSDAQPMALLVPGAEKLERAVPLAREDAVRIDALFAGYRRARAQTRRPATEHLDAWGCDPTLTKISTGDYVYDAKEDSGWFVNAQKADPGLGYNRITWDHELEIFALWHDDELWLRAL